MLEFLVSLWMAGTSFHQPAPAVGFDPPAQQTQQTQQESKAAPISCALKADDQGIVAYATGDSLPRSGSYLLKVNKTGRNTANVRSGGDFALKPGETQLLDTAKMKAGMGETVAGRLEITWDGGSTECSFR